MKSGASSCQDAYCRLAHSRHPVQSRQCSQTSAGIWLRSSADVVAFFIFLFCGPPIGEESAFDGAEKAAPSEVVHIDAAAAWRSDVAAFRDLSCKTHFSQFRGHSSPSCIPHCKRSSHRSLSHSFTHFFRSFCVFREFSRRRFGACSFVSR